MISRRKLRDFYEAAAERRRHSKAFDAWFKIARRSYWRNFQDVRATFGQTDTAVGITGRTAAIFDIGGNKYWVIAHIDYLRQTVKIEAVLDHREYDRSLWKKLF